jgi:hypothetical protein
MSCCSLLSRAAICMVVELREGGDVGRRRGNRVSLHVTFLVSISVRALTSGTLVPGDCVSTHPRDEGVGRRDRTFIGVSVGSSDGTKGLNCLGGIEEILVLVNVGVEVGTKSGSSK